MFRISVVDELIEKKVNGLEKMTIPICKEADEAIDKLKKMFAQSEGSSTLPPSPLTYEEANELLIEIRMKCEKSYR